MPIGKATKRKAKQIEEKVLASANQRDFSNKEVYLLLLDNIDRKLDNHLEFAEEFMIEFQTKYIPQFNKLQAEFIHICKELPDKGFCDKVDVMYHDMYPEGTDEPNLPSKVNLLWNDRRWLKGIMYFLLSLGLGNLIISLGNIL